MLLIKSFHIIAMVAWFSGLFYLPRLFVYHAQAKDLVSDERFCLMEWRLYYAITWPSAILTTILGFWLSFYNPHYYFKAGWFHAKLLLVVLLLAFHCCCGHYLKQFARKSQVRTSKFFRFFNEIPTLFLVSIVLLVVLKPF